jgi:hypothetical protein
LVMQMNEVLDVVYYRPMGQLWVCICISSLHGKISLPMWS